MTFSRLWKMVHECEDAFPTNRAYIGPLNSFGPAHQTTPPIPDTKETIDVNPQKQRTCDGDDTNDAPEA